jgi:ABC-type antimicrobial peptide transport system permease subunit
MTARVVGVVAPTRHQLLEEGMRPHIYTPAAQNFRAAMFLHARTNASSAEAEAAMLPDVRRMLVALDPDLPIIALETRSMYRDRNMILWLLRAGAQVFLAFGLIALFMTVVGVYGVKSYVVARRTREIGIRVALGATRRDVVNMIVRDGLLTTSIGLITGLALSVLTGLALRAMLVGDGKFDVPGVAGAGIALARRTVAGGTRRDCASGVAVLVQRLAGLPVGRIGFQSAGSLRGEVRGKVGEILFGDE